MHIHSCQFVHQQLKCVRHSHDTEIATMLRYINDTQIFFQFSVEFYRTITHWAQEQITTLIVNRDGSGLVTNGHVKLIAAVQHRILHKLRHTVRNNCIAFHLSHPETTIIRTTLHCLPREQRPWTLTAVIDLVLHHVLQPHIISGANVNGTLELLPSFSAVHYLITGIAIASIR